MILLTPDTHLHCSSPSSSPPNFPHSSSPSKLSIFYQNVRGLRTKLSLTRTTLPLEDYDIFAFTETNLDSSYFSSEIGFVKFSVHRCDRDLNYTNKKSGGGVLLAVHDRISSSLICKSSRGFEQIFVRVSIGNRYIFCVVYIPPNSPAAFFSSHFDELERLNGLYPEDIFVLVGDYNLPELSWTDVSSLPSSSSFRSTEFLDRISFF